MSNRSPITLDREALNAISALDESGGGGLLKQVVNIYLEAGPRLIAELRRASAAGDMVALRNAAHSLKSSSASLGATGLADMCKAVEHGARVGTMVDDLPSADEIEREFEAARRLLEREAALATA